MNYGDLDRMIDNLRNTIEDPSPQKGYWKGLWSSVGEIKAEFKATRYPTLADKQAAWQRLTQLLEKARARSEREKAEREQRQKAWEEKVERSQQTRDRLESKIGRTRPITDLERMIGSLILAPLTLLEHLLRDLLGLEQLDEIHENLKSCSEAMREAWAFFSENKSEMLPADRHAAYGQLNKAQERLNEAWARWKEAKHQFHQERQRQWQEKQDQWRERIEANIAKLHAKIDKAEEALGRAKTRLEKLEADYESAWNEGFKERCQGWIDEEESRIRDIEHSLDKMRGWLEDERGRLR